MTTLDPHRLLIICYHAALRLRPCHLLLATLHLPSCSLSLPLELQPT